MQSGTQNPRGFSDLNSITQCQNLDSNECGTDAVCEFNQNKCTYNCNRQTCAKTLLCRGIVEDADNGINTCLFLPIVCVFGNTSAQKCFCARLPVAIVCALVLIKFTHSVGAALVTV